ncbi:hypothetical protein [Polyangium jinanense]|uniref:Uncharacterized protein n=1 Tax=Polyangium jinanense TaxID=2829994 RepID=A0A9X4AWJ5_9BACT|nr:hypothetical protein [Polyangium jinanense]MDC3957099.1 hypothetical protein [Polyangium jinanense]MDC3986871.1 hypothetical protein [Polyangium jinanense]
MGILVFLVFVFGVYTFIARLRRKEIPEETRQLGAKLGRTAHGAIPLPGFMGQAPADYMPAEPWRETIGPPDDHTLVLDAAGRPVTNEPLPDPGDLGPYRDPAMAMALASEHRPKRRKKKQKRPTTEA